CPVLGSEEKFIHAQAVKGPVRSRLRLSGTVTKSLTPSRLTACAILPDTMVGNVVPIRVALFPPPLLSPAVVPETVAASNVQYPTRFPESPPEDTGTKLATRVRFEVGAKE